MTEETYRSLAARVDALRQQRAESRGAYAELLKQLKADFGLASLEAAEEEIKRLDAKAAGLEKKADAEYDRVTAKWGDKLGDGDAP